MRARRLDAQSLVDELYAATGLRYRVLGPCPGGQVGAAYVSGPDGGRQVLKWRPGVRVEDYRAGPQAVSEAVRAAGAPVPATLLSAQAGPDTVTVQELLPGAPAERLDHRLLDQALDLLDRQAGLLAGRPDVPRVPLHLDQDGPGFCLHEPLRLHSPRTAALERRVRAVEGPRLLAGDDAVHVDFHPGNLLTVDGRVTAVIDWDGAGRGDRLLDLVTLRFGAHAQGAPPGVVRRLDTLLDAAAPERLLPLWAHLSLRMTDWAVRHFAPGDVEHVLDLAEQRLGD
ncbi:phosphotransferase [Streptomyces sp. NPDC007088]|uniref:phosphotransferase n=1 Tax=Streptomyces sp. NPDC007088 TaxID=3364773 RepID=UPI0036C9333D